MSKGGVLNQLSKDEGSVEKSLNFLQQGCISRPCPACGGSGDWRKSIKKVVRVAFKIPCTKCTDGYVSVHCNNCIDGYTGHGVCRTCKGKGVFTYYPTKRFPDGKPCKFCKGTKEITKYKTDVATIPEVKCKRCKGTGTVAINIPHIGNPVLKESDLELLNIVDAMVDIMIPQVESDLSNIQTT